MSPRVDEQNQQIRDRRKQQLLAAGAKVFGERGYAGTKISDIVGEAELSHGLIYHYFSSKEDIYIELAKTAFMTSYETIRRAVQSSGSPYERLKAMTEGIFATPRESGHFFLIALQTNTSKTVPEEALAISREYSAKTLDLLKDLFQEGQKLGEFIQEDPMGQALMYSSLLNGVVFTRLTYPSLERFPQIGQILRMFTDTRFVKE
ncbi:MULTISPECIES: TetR/AcrR family transcriptional regulator [Paenibacillus]|uniref:TetR family transcriptional regulator n=1 Tax=Paenibacillus azoreducens TaxID=116718 RepID=A0A919YGV1_9BACL|nr:MULTISPECIES: TetR/AcrR family transcriptional regulator [Paenibacillus]MBE9914308.1 TetR/AcrR family transcriptional regulator [Paenibacillus donghaensis]GIO50401.1 TetR family transcriptional regulator [Paenibacillus azoreducens]